MKLTPSLDRDDRAALAQLGAYLFMGVCLLLAMLLLAVTAGLAVRLFLLIA